MQFTIRKANHLWRILSCLVLAGLLSACAAGSKGGQAGAPEQQGDLYPSNSNDIALIINEDYQGAQIRLDYLARAKNTIDLQYFIHDMDEFGMAFLFEVRQAARRGVKVRMVLDGMAHGLSDAMIKVLKDEGIEVREYHPLRLHKLGWIFKRMHNKVFLIDGEALLTGGRNLRNGYVGFEDHPDFRDRDIMIWLPSVISEAQKYFEDLWTSRELRVASTGGFVDEVIKADCRSRSDLSRRRECQMRQDFVLRELKIAQASLEKVPETLASLGHSLGLVDRNWKALARKITSGQFIHDPVAGKSDLVGVGPAITNMINEAKDYILIESPYLVPDPTLEAALTEATKRGVKVQILTNSAYTGDVLPVMVAYYGKEQKRLLGLGIELFEYNDKESLHAKSVVVDGRLAFVGSFNLDRLSHKKNTEVGVVFEDHEVIEQVRQDIELRIQSAWKIGPDGRPTNLGPGVSYPWAPKQNRFVLKILKWLMPLYMPFL